MLLLHEGRVAVLRNTYDLACRWNGYLVKRLIYLWTKSQEPWITSRIDLVIFAFCYAPGYIFRIFEFIITSDGNMLTGRQICKSVMMLLLHECLTGEASLGCLQVW